MRSSDFRSLQVKFGSWAFTLSTQTMILRSLYKVLVLFGPCSRKVGFHVSEVGLRRQDFLKLPGRF